MRQHQSLGDPWSFFLSPVFSAEGRRDWSNEWNSTLNTSFSINSSKRLWLEQVAEIVTSQHLNFGKCNHSRLEVGLSCIEFLDCNWEGALLPDHRLLIVLSSKYFYRGSSNHSLLSLLNDYREFASDTNKALLEISQIGNSVEFSFVNEDLSTFETDEDEARCLIVRLRLNTIFEKKYDWHLVLYMNMKDVHALPCKVLIEPFEMESFRKIGLDKWEISLSPYENLLAICSDLLYI